MRAERRCEMRLPVDTWVRNTISKAVGRVVEVSSDFTGDCTYLVAIGVPPGPDAPQVWWPARFVEQFRYIPKETPVTEPDDRNPVRALTAVLDAMDRIAERVFEHEEFLTPVNVLERIAKALVVEGYGELQPYVVPKGANDIPTGHQLQMFVATRPTEVLSA